MKTLSRFGFLMLILAFLLFVFQGISALMEKEYKWVDITLSDFTKGFFEPFIDKIPVHIIAEGLRYTINDLPLYLFLLFVAVVCIFIGAFGKN